MNENNNTPLENTEDDFFSDFVTLTDEDGVEHTFSLLDTLERNGSTYVALLAQNETPEEVLDEDDSLVIMKIVPDAEADDDVTEVLTLIEDDDEFDEVSDIFMDRLSDLFEFDVDEDEE